jgi:hypothetical protein
VVDVFGEVDEQLRADRLRTFMQRAIPAFIVALVLSVLAVVAVWGVQAFVEHQNEQAAKAYTAALDVGAKGDQAKAFDQLDAIAKGGGPYAPLALMQQAGIRSDQNRPLDAVRLLDKAAAAGKLPIIADLASLKAAYLLMDTAPLNQISDRLAPLAKPDRPYHIQAREALALAKLAAGKTGEAKADLVAETLLADTPDSARQRAQAIIALIDSGTASSLKSLAEQAKTATPIPLPSPAQPGAQAGPGAPDGPAPPQDPPEAPQ